MRYFLDGNNLTGSVFKNAGSEGSREQLFIYLQRKKLPKQTTIVFDGVPFRTAVNKGSLRMVFSERGSADDLILSQIKKGDIVVTRDRELQSRARVRGAKILEPADFFRKVEPKGGGLEKPLQENDVEGWLKTFGANGDGN